MQTTLRINDEIYRRAKSKAAQEGITITKFIEEALCIRMGEETEISEKVKHSETSLESEKDEGRILLIQRLEQLFELADERDRLKEGSAGPFTREELYAERLERFR